MNTERQAANEPLAEFEAVTLKPRFECNKSGVYFIGVKTDKEGTVSEQAPVRLADPIHLELIRK